MSQVRQDTFRSALQVSPERIAAMADAELNALMGELLSAHAHRCGSPIGEIRVNTEGRAKDDGSDGWSARPQSADDWFGTADTCWQFKAGGAGGPAKLRGEVIKRIPRETLTNGGRFVVVASGSTNGKMGEDARRAALVKEASENSIPVDRIEVIGSDRLARWCNQHPAIAAHWAGHPAGWSLENWSSAQEHQVAWQASDAVKAELAARRTDLDFNSGSLYHLHIQGPPGVGKTRFALELCREATWRGAVIYIRQAADVRLTELIDGATADVGVQLLVVVDEVQQDQLRPLRDSLDRGNGRIRLITIGHSGSPDPARTPALKVEPLESQLMRAVIRGWYESMPLEHVDFIVRFADGYIRLAKLAADAVVANPGIDVRQLLNRSEISGFLDRMFGSDSKRALHVVAVLAVVGWTDDKQAEGEAIARHLRLDWNDVRAAVEQEHNRSGIAPRGGRYRYISPDPLGIYLAVDAWNTYPELIRSLPGVLPSEEARDAYHKRLESIASNPATQQFAREALTSFFQLDDFVEARAARRWSALSAADTDAAAHNILKALSGASVNERLGIPNRSRREIVWTLVRIAWKATAFHDAVLALAMLAEAENETWANNATAEFVAKFEIALGGTSLPYPDRLEVLDELLAQNRLSLAFLVIKALSQVGQHGSFRAVNPPISDAVPQEEWHPRNNAEHVECAQGAIAKLTSIAKMGLPGVDKELVSAADKLAMLLRYSTTRNYVITFYEAVRDTYPETREQLWKAITDIVNRERKYWKDLPPEELQELECLRSNFEETTLGARLRQTVGQLFIDLEEEPDLNPIAAEILRAPTVIEEQWEWLTSGEAQEGWRLGEALAEIDHDEHVLTILADLAVRGGDLRVVCGYVGTRRRIAGDDWYNKWVASQLERNPRPLVLFFDVMWRCGVTEPMAKIIVSVLRDEKIDRQLVGRLSFGRWGETLSVDSLKAVLQAMADTGHSETAVQILSQRIKDHPAELDQLDLLALSLATERSVIRGSQMVSFYWQLLAKVLVSNHAGEIATAIFREQADRKSGSWFSAHSQATEVLQQCVERDPGAVWQAMKPHLSPPSAAAYFTIGFPRGLIEGVPAEEVGAWIAEKPEERASIIAKLTSNDMSTDDTLASCLVGAYGDNDRVANAFFSEYITGSWWGSVSAHWEELARSMDAIAKRTALPKLRRWASQSAGYLREMAERDKQREEEEALRDR